MTESATAALFPPSGAHAGKVRADEHHVPGSGRRWWALAVMSLAQLLITVDVTIVNVALPQVQRSLGFSDVLADWRPGRLPGRPHT